MCLYDVLVSIFSKDGVLSTKRIIGTAGLVVIFGLLIYCTIEDKQMPAISEFLAGCCVTLLGIDPVTDVVKSYKNTTQNDQSQD